jgi:signal transduction histidine kinase
MLAMVGELSPQQKSCLQIILNNVARMSHQVSDLSDISRIESGRLKVEIEEEVDFRESLEQVIRSVQAEIVQREHTLLLDIPEDLPAVRADPQRLAQIFTNLISNAYKYTPNGGVITIRAAHEGRFVWCEVQDTGVGILPEEMAKLFTKFWRADNQYVREQHGTGLGLAIAKSLVEMQGGTLTATSEKDVGTTFQFTVPVSK